MINKYFEMINILFFIALSLFNIYWCFCLNQFLCDDCQMVMPLCSHYWCSRGHCPELKMSSSLWKFSYKQGWWILSQILTDVLYLYIVWLCGCSYRYINKCNIWICIYIYIILWCLIFIFYQKPFILRN